MKKNVIIRFIRFWAVKFNNIHLKNKLLICYGSLIVFAVFVVGFFSYYNVQAYIYKQASESYSQTLEQVKLNIEYKLNIYYELLNQIASTKSFVFALADEYSSPGDSSFEYLNTISKAFEIKGTDTTSNILDIFILKNNDTLPEVGQELIKMKNAENTWWYKKYFAGTGSFTINDYIRFSKSKIWFVTDEDLKPRYIPSNNSKPETKVAIVKPVIFSHEKLVGILEMYIKFEAIFGEFMTKDNSEGDHLFIADESNEVIFNSLLPISGDKPKLNEDYLLQTKGKDTGSFLIENSSSRKFVLFSKGKDSGWTYFRELPVKNLFASANAVRQFTISIAIISIIVSFIIAIAIGSRLSRRISILSKKMEQVEDLTLDVNVKIDGRDEIGKLAKNYNRMIQKIRELVEQLTSSQQLQKESEMKALQAQINPHFLYNTLATINWMAMDNDSEKIISMVDNLSVFYRLSLNKGREYLTIGEEVKQVEAYMNIQKIRLEDKIQVVYEIDKDIIDYCTPKLILQPFVENAILHGAESNHFTTTVTIKGYPSGNRVVLEVIDDGVGMDHVPQPGEYPTMGGYGIRNVHEKIQLRYGSEYGVEMLSEPGIGTRVSITIPIVTVNPNL